MGKTLSGSTTPIKDFVAGDNLGFAAESPTSEPEGTVKVIRDPQLQIVLCDRIYELMAEDLRRQRERLVGYGGR